MKRTSGQLTVMSETVSDSGFWRVVWRIADRAHLAPSFSRDANSDGFAYARSYLSIRRLAGVIGLAMPISLVFYDVLSIKGPGISVKGSVSAYYFSDARDLFVGCLFAVGFLLLTYMAGAWATSDFWLSVFAGAGVLVVANLPTRPPGDVTCKLSPRPPSCAFVQHKLGEDTVWWIHTGGAALFVVCSIGLSLVFALREVKFAMQAGVVPADSDKAKRKFFLYLLLAATTAASGVVALGPDFTVHGLHNIWLGELGAFTSFAASWLLAGRIPLRRRAIRQDAEIVKTAAPEAAALEHAAPEPAVPGPAAPEMAASQIAAPEKARDEDDPPPPPPAYAGMP